MTSASLPSSPPPRRMAGERELVVMLAMLMALNAMAIDAMLPALPDIARQLHVATANYRQFVISAYLLGIAVGSLAYGPLADRYGRKPVLRLSVAAYTLLALGCALAPSFPLLLALRLGQGLAGAALGVVATAVIRDLFVGDAMARRMSMIFLVFMVVPIIAPTIGAGIAWIAGWRAIFIVLAMLGLIMMAWMRRLPETLDPRHVRALDIGTMVSGWFTVARHRRAAGYMLASGVIQGGLYGYLNSGEQIIGDVFGARDWFPLIFAIIAGGIAFANFSNSRIVERFGARRVSQTALFVYIGVALLQWALAATGHETLVQFTLCLTVIIGLVGFTGSNFGSIAMEDFGGIAGLASSYQSFAKSLLAVVVGVVIGQLYDGTTRPLALSFVTAGLIALMLVLWGERGKLFTRPGTAPRHPV